MIIEHHESLNGAILSRSISGKITGLGEKNLLQKSNGIYKLCFSSPRYLCDTLYCNSRQKVIWETSFWKIGHKILCTHYSTHNVLMFPGLDSHLGEVIAVFRKLNLFTVRVNLVRFSFQMPLFLEFTLPWFIFTFTCFSPQ